MFLQAPPNLGGEIFDGNTANIGNQKCKKKTKCSLPPFNASLWTVNPWTLEANSNYNYAFSMMTSTYSTPGSTADMAYNSITVEEIRGAAVFDGALDYKHTDTESFPDTSYDCLVAVAIIPGLDYQWLRRDDDDNWSYKIGSRNAPTNLDNNGAVITDPRTADLAPYKAVRFMGYCPDKMALS